MIPDVEDVLAAEPRAAPAGERLGVSREGRPVVGHRFGSGRHRVSLIAGCHADEPIGPMLLRRLVAYLSDAGHSHAGPTRLEWWIVPDVNPDGAARNAAWAESLGETIDPVEYVRHASREPPGDDVEFGFPRGPTDTGARPENRALARWWRSAAGPFALHASLHGMAVAHGPWFLIEGSWRDRSEELQTRCRSATAALGYRLHDVDRHGEKGFVRIGPGFTTRPDSREMIRFFRDRGDDATAALFRPSSMETIVALGGDPLTLVSEMPLFVIPPEPAGTVSTSEDVVGWGRRFAEWRRRLISGDEAGVRGEIAGAGIAPMPIRDQMRLQWTFVAAGIEQALA